MTERNGLFLSNKRIADWREEDARLEKEIAERVERRADIRRKLEAADILSEEFSSPLNGPRESAAVLEEPGDDEPASVAAAFVANMLKTGDSLKVQQCKKRLADIGFPDEANRKNYIYGLLYRLTKSGRLLKRGTKYRAAPISSPEGETEAVGASVRH